MNSRLFRMVGTVIYLILVGLSLFFLYNAYTATNRNPSALASAAATTALVFLTAFYVHFTWRLAHESEQTRKQAISPAFVLDFGTASRLEEVDGVRLINVGQGPAYDVTAKIHLLTDEKGIISRIQGQTSSEYTELLNTPNIRQDYFIQIPDNPFQELLTEINDERKLQIEVIYTNQLEQRDDHKIIYLSNRLTPHNEAPAE